MTALINILGFYTDGKFFVRVCLLCTDLTANEFFRASANEESRYMRLRRLLSELFQTDIENVDIFSLASGSQPMQHHLSVWFAAHGSPYYRPEKLHGYMAMHKAKVTKTSAQKLTLHTNPRLLCFSHRHRHGVYEAFHIYMHLTPAHNGSINISFPCKV